jgi:HNH endonuclease
MRQNHLRRTIEQWLAAQSEIDPLSGCHIWQGRRNSSGYPVVSFHGRQHLVHRLTWTLRYGRIRDGMELCHRCDEPRCINPDHHFVGTHQANMADMREKRRARLERATADLRGEGSPLPDARPEELTPMRLYVRGVEITGKVLIRPFIAGAPTPARRPPAATRPNRRAIAAR